MRRTILLAATVSLALSCSGARLTGGRAEGQVGAEDGARRDSRQADEQSPSVEGAPSSASWRYGGGVGYPDIVDPGIQCAAVVSSRAELESALAAAEPGDVVYVSDGAVIDLTGVSLCVPGGVWLASGRGRDGSAGGVLTTTETVRRPILRACGDDVRVTGLRILGNDSGQCPPEYPDACTGNDRTGGVNCRDCTPGSSGLEAVGVDRLEVDNCELAGWSGSAILLSDSVGDHIHHNDIHHNQRKGLGYGVVLVRGGDGLVTVLVEHNRFDYNRHAIAGTGEPGEDYEARNNLVLQHASGHVFDMHGENENTGNGSEWAGGEILVHDNTVLVPDRYTLVVRGRPQRGPWLYANCLARQSAEDAALQRYFFGDFHVDESPAGSAPNAYGQLGSDCETVRWCMTQGAAGPWAYGAATSVGVQSLGFADFDGDGRTDVMRTTGTEWQWSRAGTARWAHLNTSLATLAGLVLGDFDGDGHADVFRATGSEWRVSDGGTSRWRVLRAATETLDELAFGDFDGDGRTDAMRATGSEWLWSSGATAAWEHLNSSKISLGGLALGDFDGDGVSDVFRANGSEWLWSAGGSAAWARLNTSGATLPSLALYDFDGDGVTDVLRARASVWEVSWGGRTAWSVVRIASEGLEEIRFGDFDGDGRADAFRGGCF